VKRGWLVAALGGLLGIGGAAAYVWTDHAMRAKESIRSQPLSEELTKVTAWLDNRLLEAAATRAAEQPGVEDGVVDAGAFDITEQREHMYWALARFLNVEPELVERIAATLDQSPYACTGNPAVTVHPISPAQCAARRAQARVERDDAAVCGAPNMVAVFDPSTSDVLHATVCIDQYEFPNIPCEYPLVWVRSSEAVQICQILGKRLCDAHEWEGACAGNLLPAEAEYSFSVLRAQSTEAHNQSRIRTWLGSLAPLLDVCPTNSFKNSGCGDVTWEECGTNTYPAGSFPECVSPFGAYDMLGNVAEHMNLPLSPEQMASHGGVGQTEMKGSWFAHDGLMPYPDDCRWRAPAWHATAVDSPLSHRNYQLGFRCCKDVNP